MQSNALDSDYSGQAKPNWMGSFVLPALPTHHLPPFKAPFSRSPTNAQKEGKRICNGKAAIFERQLPR